jgi:hypothetical protein
VEGGIGKLNKKERQKLNNNKDYKKVDPRDCFNCKFSRVNDEYLMFCFKTLGSIPNDGMRKTECPLFVYEYQIVMQ